VPDRDLFANFERMMAHRSRGGFSPAVDVYYVGDPPRAVVRAELAGVDPAGIALEIRGRELIISGTRPPQSGEDRVYQQLEIEHGPFRRVVPLGADVDEEGATAAYEDGMLIVELPLAPPKRPHTVRIEPGRDGEAT